MQHFNDDQDHADRVCKWLANKRKEIIIMGLSFNNSGLDQQKGMAEKHKKIRLASVFGRTSTC